MTRARRRRSRSTRSPTSTASPASTSTGRAAGATSPSTTPPSARSSHTSRRLGRRRCVRRPTARCCGGGRRRSHLRRAEPQVRQADDRAPRHRRRPRPRPHAGRRRRRVPPARARRRRRRRRRRRAPAARRGRRCGALGAPARRGVRGWSRAAARCRPEGADLYGTLSEPGRPSNLPWLREAPAQRARYAAGRRSQSGVLPRQPGLNAVEDFLGHVASMYLSPSPATSCRHSTGASSQAPPSAEAPRIRFDAS